MHIRALEPAMTTAIAFKILAGHARILTPCAWTRSDHGHCLSNGHARILTHLKVIGQTVHLKVIMTNSGDGQSIWLTGMMHGMRAKTCMRLAAVSTADSGC